MFIRAAITLALFFSLNLALAKGESFDQKWTVSGDHYVLKSNPEFKVVFSVSSRGPASRGKNITAKELKSQMEEFKRSRKSFGDEPKITDWKVAGSGIEEDGKQKWILMEGSFKTPTGETEKFYEIHYYAAGKAKVASIHYPEKTSPEEANAAIKSVREKIKE